VQSAVVYRLTVPLAAVPLISGKLSLAGESGSVLDTVGVAGGDESSVYAIEVVEQGDVFPAVSVAVARNVVVVLSRTVTESPGLAKSEPEPAAATVLVHPAFV
jgi:hypothetical protein